jgi:hypothetical protein
VGESTHHQQVVGYHKFQAFCRAIGMSEIQLYTIPTSELKGLLRRFAIWMFFQGLNGESTIPQYVANAKTILSQYQVITVPEDLHDPLLLVILKGIERESLVSKPRITSHKLPFTRAMINKARTQVLLNLSTMAFQAIHAALCLAFMFLLRKSEYLTSATGLLTKRPSYSKRKIMVPRFIQTSRVNTS